MILFDEQEERQPVRVPSSIGVSILLQTLFVMAVSFVAGVAFAWQLTEPDGEANGMHRAKMAIAERLQEQ